MIFTQTCNKTKHHRIKRTNGVDSPLYSWSILIEILSFPHHFGCLVLHLMYVVLLVWPLLQPLYSHWYWNVCLYCNYYRHRHCHFPAHSTQPITNPKQTIFPHFSYFFRVSACVCDYLFVCVRVQVFLLFYNTKFKIQLNRCGFIRIFF